MISEPINVKKIVLFKNLDNNKPTFTNYFYINKSVIEKDHCLYKIV